VQSCIQFLLFHIQLNARVFNNIQNDKKNLLNSFRDAQANFRAKSFHPAPTPTTSFRGAQAIFRAKLFHVQYPTFSTAVTLHTYSPMKMEQTECSETLAFRIQTPGNNPEESTQHSEHGENLNLRKSCPSAVY
jgi:hypothetical protein